MNITRVHKCFEGLVQCWEHDSVQTGTRMRFMSYVPSEKPRACLIWLAGYGGNEESFLTRIGAQKYLADTRLMVVCPDTSPRGLHLPQEHDSWDFGSGAGFYVDAVTPGFRNHYRMYSYVADELYRLIVDSFAMQGHISIMGEGMGGHGALIMALREGRKFRSVSAFAPIAQPTRCLLGQKALQGYLGDNDDLWRSYDACDLLNHGYGHNGTILIDLGAEDEQGDAQLHIGSFEKACQERGQPLQVMRRVGYDHSPYFISSFISEHILFHAEYLV